MNRFQNLDVPNSLAKRWKGLDSRPGERNSTANQHRIVD